MNRISLLMAAALALGACASDLPHEAPFDPETAAARQAQGEVSGRVRLAGEADFAGIDVQLQGAARSFAAKTAADGAFRITGVVPGDYQLTASTRYFTTHAASVRVGIGERVELGAAALAPRTASVAGSALLERLRDGLVTQEGRVALRLARTASIRGAASPAMASAFAPAAETAPVVMTAISSEDGAYAFHDVPAGAYELVATTQGAPAVTVTGIEVTGEDDVAAGEIVLQPVTGFFVIEGVAAGVVSRTYTATPNVILKPSGFHAASMRIGTSATGRPGDCVLGAEVPYAVTASRTLTAEGAHTYCVQFLAADGTPSETTLASIVYDASPPIPGALRVNNGAAYTQSNQLALSLSAFDVTSGVTAMKIAAGADPATAPAQPFQSFLLFPVSAAEGRKTVFAAFGDAAGNYSSPVSASITLDAAAPVISVLQLEDGLGNALSTARTRQVIVRLDASDFSPLEMKLGNQPDLTAAPWIAYQSHVGWELPPVTAAGGESRAVYARVRDAAGREASAQTPAVLLDTIGPSGVSLTAAAAVTTAPSIALTLAATNADWAELSTDIAFTSPVSAAPNGPAVFALSGGDGPKTIYARFGDNAGNRSGVVATSVLLDQTPPQLASFVITEGALTRGATLHLALTALDAAEVQVSENACGGPWQPFASALAYPLADTSEGLKTIAVRFRDVHGNPTPCLTQTTTLDTQAPGFTAAFPLRINAGATYATDRTVTLSLAVTGAAEVQVSESPALAGAPWLPASDSLTFALSAGDGVKTVFFRARDAAGNVTAIQSDAITVDTQAPAFNSAGAPALASVTAVTLALVAADAAEMRISEDPTFAAAAWQSYAPNPILSLASSEGAHTLYIQLRDAAGNLSLVRSVSLVLDTTAPAAPVVNLVSPRYTKTTAVSVQIVAEEAGEMLLSQWAPMTDATWQPYALLKSFTLAGADGPKSVYVKLRDAAGNIGPAASVAVTLDTQPPVVTLFRAEDGLGNPLAATNTLGYQLRLDASDASPLTVQYNAANLFGGVASEPYAPLHAWSVLPPVNPAGEARTAYARLADAAGNDVVVGPVSVLVDTIAPGLPDVVAPALVSSTTVSVQLHADDADWAELAGDVGFLAPLRFSMRAATSYTLTAGDGPKTIYARYADDQGNYSPIVSTTLTLDTQAPAGADLVIEEAPLTPLLTVHLQLTAAGAAEMQVSEDDCDGAWVPFSAEAAYTFASSLDGTKTIAARFRDGAANATACLLRTVTLDTTAPWVTSVSPYSGFAYKEVTINGFNFGDSPVGSRVTIGTGVADVLAWSNTQIQILIPKDASVGLQPLVVRVNGRDSLPVNFNVLPLIRFVTPALAPAGSSVTLVGLNFGAAPGVVRIGGVEAPVQAWTPTAVTVAVPASLPVGVALVQATAAMGNPSNLSSLTVMPYLAAAAPPSGVSGTQVSLTGAGFGALQGASRVTFGGVAAAVVSWSDSAIEALVPAAANPATVPVQVTVANVASHPLGFVHQRPWIHARVPNVAAPGQLVRVQGLYFGAAAGTVLVGEAAAPVSSWTDTEIALFVPAVSATTKAMGITTATLAVSNRVPLFVRGNDMWLPTGEEPVSRTDFDAIAAGPEIFVFGMVPGSGASAARYNASTDTWLPAAKAGTLQNSTPSMTWTGTEVILWGGAPLTCCASASQEGARYNPLTDSWSPVTTAGAPAARQGHRAAWTGAEMIVWGGGESGGWGAGLTGPGTGGRYDPVLDAWTPTTTASAPTARKGFAAEWTGQYFVVWGGTRGYFTDPSCGWMGMCDVLVADGGRYDPASDTWLAMSLEDAPSPRHMFGADWSGSELLVWGGMGPNMGMYYGDGARYNPAADSWEPMTGAGAPTGRYDLSAVWAGDALVVYGGWAGMGSGDNGAKYLPGEDRWVALATAGAPAGVNARGNVFTGRDVIYMRSLGGTRYNPVADAWSPISIGQAIPVYNNWGNEAVAAGGQLMVWGLPANTGALGQGGLYSPATNSWKPVNKGAGAPLGRSSHAMVWTGSEVLVWGGYNNPLPSTGARYDPATDAWAPMSETGQPTPRYDATAVWTGDRMIVWGGRDGFAPQVDTGGRYDPVADLWQPTAVAGAPSARLRHAAAWGGDAMYVWGGEVDAGGGNRICMLSGGRYYPASDTWSTLGTSGVPSPRVGAAIAWAGSHLIVWGGENCNNSSPTYYGDGGRYYPAGDTWDTLPALNAPEPRSWPANAFDGRELFVWGGFYSIRTGGRYDSVLGTWRALPALDAPPAPQSMAQGAWVAGEFLIWTDAPYYLGRYAP